MDTIGAFEAKTHLSSPLDRVAKGERITITKHGMPVAELVPIAADDRARRLEAIERLKTFAKGRVLGMDWHELRDTGRQY